MAIVPLDSDRNARCAVSLSIALSDAAAERGTAMRDRPIGSIVVLRHYVSRQTKSPKPRDLERRPSHIEPGYCSEDIELYTFNPPHR